ncbi:MAG: hypothetical protein ABWY78_06240 [Microvirga sp.]
MPIISSQFDVGETRVKILAVTKKGHAMVHCVNQNRNVFVGGRLVTTDTGYLLADLPHEVSVEPGDELWAVAYGSEAEIKERVSVLFIEIPTVAAARTTKKKKRSPAGAKKR